MSELAFNLNGEPFEFPANAAGLRVRRIHKGAPKTVYGVDGPPLTLPIDADIDDLRRETRGVEGRYRLDPVDEDNKTIGNCPAGYVYVHPTERSEETATSATRIVHGPQDPIVEAMRMNTELARTVVDKLPLVMESAAGLLRAASDAGLPTRLPRFLFEAPAEAVGDEEDAESDAPTNWLDRLQKFLPYVGPLLSAVSAGGFLKIPGGAGALLDCRRASAAGSETASTSGAVSAPGPSDPAPARRASPGSRPVPSRARRPVEALGPAAPGSGGAVADVAGEDAPSSVPTGLPTLDAAALAHFAAIEAELTLEERMFAHALVAELTPAQLREWLAQLKPLSVPEALAQIRAAIGAGSVPAAQVASSPALPAATGGAA